MKKTILTIAMILGSLATGWCDSQPNIIPAPQKMQMGEGTFVVKKGLTIVSKDVKDFSANYLQDKLDDVFEGIYHGTGPDLTEEMRGYANKMITSGELKGLVPVDARLAEILQLLMDKYTFENVDNSWTKLCYYYRYVGPSK